jgi:spermidine synthase
MKLNSNKNILTIVIIIIGFTSIVAQVQFMRELVNVFFGNELSLGTILGVWLIWNAIGSSFLPKLIKNNSLTRKLLAFLQISFSIILLFIFILIRLSKYLLPITLGEMIGFIPMFITIVIILAPFCLLSGLCYTLTCQLIYNDGYSIPSAIGKVYIFEAVGAGIGGLIASLLFFKYFHPASVILFLSFLNISSAIILINLSYFNSKKFQLISAFFLFLTGICCLKFSSNFQTFTDKLLWKGYNLVTTQNTVYGNLAITKIGDQYSFFENGLLLFTLPDRRNAEEVVHFALLEHSKPENILLIGGGLNGALSEILRHPTVKKISYVELDPHIVLLARKILPANQIRFLNDSRIQIHHIDGRRFLKHTNEKYDVIILNLPNPYTAQLNRFYTVEFFAEVNDILNPGGLLSLQVSSSENAIGTELSDFLSTLSTTLKSVFIDLIIIPGETNRFIASNRPELLTSDPWVLVERLKQRNLETIYIREYYFPYHMTKERQEYLKSKIYTVHPDKINFDFKPIGYYYDTLLWATYFSSAFKKIFIAVAAQKTSHFIAFFIFVTALIILFKWRPSKKSNFISTSVLFSVLNFGFSEISVEFILILGYQVLYGHVYQHLALIVAGYMIGLAIGSWFAIIYHPVKISTFQLFRILQLIMVFFPLFISIILWTFHKYNISAISPNWTGLLFPSLTAFAGFTGGCQFILANSLFIGSQKSIKETAGFLYGVDLIGSAAGAIITASFLIPIFGFYTTLTLLSVLNLCSFSVLLLYKE